MKTKKVMKRIFSVAKRASFLIASVLLMGVLPSLSSFANLSKIKVSAETSNDAAQMVKPNNIDYQNQFEFIENKSQQIISSIFNSIFDKYDSAREAEEQALEYAEEKKQEIINETLNNIIGGYNSSKGIKEQIIEYFEDKTGKSFIEKGDQDWIDEFQSKEDWFVIFSGFSGQLVLNEDGTEKKFVVGEQETSIKDFELSEHNFFNNKWNKELSPEIGDGFSGSFKSVEIDGVIHAKGTEQNPFLITTEEELVFFSYVMSNGVDAHSVSIPVDGSYFRLSRDLNSDEIPGENGYFDLGNYRWKPISNSSYNVSLDGSSMPIFNLYSQETDYVGLFGNANVTNLKNIIIASGFFYIEQNSVEKSYAGSLIAKNQSKNIELNSLVNFASIKSANDAYAGGIIGHYLAGSEDINSYLKDIINFGNVSIDSTEVNSYSSGVIGYATIDGGSKKGIFEASNVFNAGNISNLSNKSYLGGVYGFLQARSTSSAFTGILSKLINWGTITAGVNALDTSFIGGLIGESSFANNKEQVVNSYNYGNVQTDSNNAIVNGIARRIANIQLSYNFGEIKGGRQSNGFAYDTKIEKCINFGSIISVGLSSGFSYTCSSIDNSINFGQISVETVTASQLLYSGGFISFVSNSARITNSINYGNIYGVSKGGMAYIGGFIGRSTQSIPTNTFSNVINYGNVNSINSSSNAAAYLGGFIGGSVSVVKAEHAINWGIIGDENNSSSRETTSSGGLLGSLSSRDTVSTFENVYNMGLVYSNFYLGGLIGDTGSRANIQIKSSINFGNIYVKSSRGFFVGGLLGNVSDATVIIMESLNLAKIKAINTSSSSSYNSNIGGFVGKSNGSLSIKNSLVAGEIHTQSTNGEMNIGGLVGHSSGKIDSVINNQVYGNIVSESAAKNNIGWLIGNSKSITNVVNNYSLSKIEIYFNDSLKEICSAFGSIDLTYDSLHFPENYDRTSKIYNSNIRVANNYYISQNVSSITMQDRLDPNYIERNDSVPQNIQMNKNGYIQDLSALAKPVAFGNEFTSLSVSSVPSGKTVEEVSDILANYVSVFKNNAFLSEDEAFQTESGKYKNLKHFNSGVAEINNIDLRYELQEWNIGYGGAPYISQGFDFSIVIYDANGGQGDVQSSQISDASSIVVPGATHLIKGDNSFAYWTSRQSGIGSKLEAGDSILSDPNQKVYILFAQFTKTEFMNSFEKTDGLEDISTDGIFDHSGAILQYFNGETGAVLRTVLKNGFDVDFISFQAKDPTTQMWQDLGVGEKTVSLNGEVVHSLNIASFFDSEFINQFSNKKEFIFRAYYSSENIKYQLTINENIGNGNLYYNGSETLSGQVVSVNKDAQNSFVAVPMNKYNVFSMFEITYENGSKKLYDKDSAFVSSLSNGRYEIKYTMSEPQQIRALFENKKYDILLESVNTKGDVLAGNQIYNNGLNRVSIGQNIGALFIGSVDNEFRFIGFRYAINGVEIPSLQGSISEFALSEEIVDKYSFDDRITIQAVFARQSMVTFYPGNNSEFEGSYIVKYIDYTGNWVVITNPSYIMIDNDTEISIKFSPQSGYYLPMVEGMYSNEELISNELNIYVTENRYFEFNYQINVFEISILSIDSYKEIIANINNNFTLLMQDQNGNAVNQLVLFNLIELSLNLENQPEGFKFLNFTILNTVTGEMDELVLIGDNMIQPLEISNEFVEKYVDENSDIQIFLNYAKLYSIKVDNSLVGENSGEINIFINGVSQEYKTIYYSELDSLIRIEFVPSKYYRLNSISGVSNTERNEHNQNEINLVLKEDRQLIANFVKDKYKLNIVLSGEFRGEIEQVTKYVSVNDDIILNFNPDNSYQLLDWKINGKNITSMDNVVVNGSSITVKADAAFLDEFEIKNNIVSIDSEIRTVMNVFVLYLIIFIPTIVLLISALILFVAYRRKIVKKQALAIEEQLKQASTRFNITNIMQDLRK